MHIVQGYALDKHVVACSHTHTKRVISSSCFLLPYDQLVNLQWAQDHFTPVTYMQMMPYKWPPPIHQLYLLSSSCSSLLFPSSN